MLLVLGFMTSLTFTACGDDNDDPGGGSSEKSLVGEWEIESAEDDGKTFVPIFGEDFYKDYRYTGSVNYWNFNSDGTGEVPFTWGYAHGYDFSDYEFDGLTPDDFDMYGRDLAKDGTLWLYAGLIYKWTLSGNNLRLYMNKTKIYKDVSYTSAVKQVSVSEEAKSSYNEYEVEFLSNDRVKLTVNRDNRNSWWSFYGLCSSYILKRKSGSSMDASKYDERLTQQIPEEYLDKLAKYMTINQGSSPRNIEGVYLYCPAVVFDETKSYDKGYQMAAEYLRLSSQNTSKNTLTVEEKFRTNETSKSTNAVILGQNEKFTIFYISEGTQSGIKFKTATVISGTWTSDGIKNLQHALLTLSKGSDPSNKIMPVGYIRVFQEGFNPVSDVLDESYWQKGFDN